MKNEIILNKDLEIIDFKDYQLNNMSKEHLLSSLGINDDDDAYFSDNFGKYHFSGIIEYLQIAYNNHYGIVLSPELIWQTAMYQISSHIKDNSAQYEHLFVRTPDNEKTTLSVRASSDIRYDIYQLVKVLHDESPLDTNLFLPKFSTLDVYSDLSINVSLLDAVSPYYDYSMFMCGIPKVQITGTTYDWDLIIANIYEISKIMPMLKQYADRIVNIVEHIKNHDAEYLSKIFSIKPIGSGGDLKLNGWIKELLIDTSISKMQDYPSCLSSIEFLYVGKKQKITTGVMSFDIVDGYAVPKFSYIIQELETK